MVNEMTVVIKIRSGKMTPLEITGYFKGRDDQIQLPFHLTTKEKITIFLINRMQKIIEKEYIE